ncbi:hypothetical protein J4207_02200 [Candidatus Woesearchaeota archaeon]|nr:hypothetical protein [Candidatus Woesearchaeota archaeon]
MAHEKENPVGEAYSFFHYAGQTEQIEIVLPDIRKGTSMPPDLTVRVNSIDNVNTRDDPALEKIVQRAKQAEMSHVLEATLPGIGNRGTAKVLGDLMIGLYYELYKQSEILSGDIAYKRGDKYVLKRD